MDDGSGNIYKPETDRNSIWVSSNRGFWCLVTLLCQWPVSRVNLIISHALYTPSPSWYKCHKGPFLTLSHKKSSQIWRSAYILLCDLVVDVHVSQADTELPSTGDHSTVSGCALPLQLKDAAHVLKQRGQLHTEHVSLLCHTQLTPSVPTWSPAQLTAPSWEKQPVRGISV